MLDAALYITLCATQNERMREKTKQTKNTIEDLIYCSPAEAAQGTRGLQPKY